MAKIKWPKGELSDTKGRTGMGKGGMEGGDEENVVNYMTEQQTNNCIGSHQHKIIKQWYMVITNIANLYNHGNVVFCEKSGNYLYGRECLVWRFRLHHAYT